MTESRFELLEMFVRAGVLSVEEAEPVMLAAERFGEEDPLRILGLAFAVSAPGLGHVGVRLDEICALLRGEHDERAQDAATQLPWPRDPTAFARHTLSSPLVGHCTADARPFVRVATPQGELLMTHRLATEEEQLAAALRRRLEAPDLPQGSVEEHLPTLFPGDLTGAAVSAVRLAARRPLAIVTGGPGSGKTFSVKRLLAALLLDRPNLTIRLAAPTGKAAVRMEEALAEADSLALPDEVRRAFAGLRGETIHRLIGQGREGPPRHHEKHPIAADVIVVDEVSMADVTLMRRLVAAVPVDARLVLLGDPDQLPSVDAGCVLADLEASQRLAAARISFSLSHRFSHLPQVARAAACLQSRPAHGIEVPESGDARLAEAVTLLTPDDRSPSAVVRWLPAEPGANGRLGASQLDALVAPYRDGYLTALARLPEAPDTSQLLELLQAFDAYRILTLTRRGPSGATALDPTVARRLGLGDRRFPHGRPIIVTENAYDLDLFNGDIGLVVHLRGRPTAIFRIGRAGVRAVPVDRLPAHEGAFVMTVHKSQGSQFGRVALVMPGRTSRLATRELVYTGLTRVREGFTWLGTREELEEALGRRLYRWSALAARLDAN